MTLIKFMFKDSLTRFNMIIMTAALIAMGIQAYRISKIDNSQVQNVEYENQVEALNKVQNSIDNLMIYVSKQRAQLKLNQNILNNLKDEKNKLEPLVNADRGVVETLFKIQAERNASNIWFERLIGFVIGVFSSLLASIVFTKYRQEGSNQKIKRTA